MARDQSEQIERKSERDRVRLSRRTYLKMAGISIAAAGALSNRSQTTKVPETTSMAIYGYGGTQVFEQQGSITASGFSGTVEDLTPMSESESNDRRATADSVSIGSTVTAELTEAEVDWYAFDAESGQSVVIELDRESGRGVTALILYDTKGNYLNLKYVGTAQPTQIELDSAPTAGTYYFQVVDIQSGDGPYTLTVRDQRDVTPTPTDTPTPTETETPTPTPVPEQQPYYGTVRDGTKRIEAEEYDEGGEGVAFHDLTDENLGGKFRSESVDIERTTDDDGYNVGWIDEGEWLEYTISLPAGKYDLNARVATWGTGREMRVLLDGTELGVIEIPETGSSQNWETATLSDLTVETDGEHVLRVEALNSGFNINWFQFEETRVTPTPVPTVTSTPTQTPTATPTPTQTPIPTLTPIEEITFGAQGYGEYGYGGVR